MTAIEFDSRAVFLIAERQQTLLRPIVVFESLGDLLAQGFEAIQEDLRRASTKERNDVANTFVALHSSRVWSDRQEDGRRIIMADVNDSVFSTRLVAWFIVTKSLELSDTLRAELQTAGCTELLVLPTNEQLQVTPGRLPLGVPAIVVPLTRVASAPAALFYDQFCDEYAHSMAHARAKQGIADTLTRFGYSHNQMLADAATIRRKANA